MQFGGCYPGDTCQREPFPGAFFQYLAANVFSVGTGETILPAYEIKKIDNAKIAFIGLTLEATPTIVTPAGVAGLEFRPEIADDERARREASQRERRARLRRAPASGRLPESAGAGRSPGRRIRTRTPTSTVASTSAAPRSPRSRRASTRGWT